MAQKPPIKFGEVSIDELKMKRYDKDTTASAIVLCDYGESRIEYLQGKGFSVKFERVRRVKIFSKEGYDWGNFSIPIYKSGTNEEDLTTLKAITYNLENGKIVESKLKNDAIFTEEADKNTKIVKFALSNVKEGSVIEILYKVSSPFTFNFQDWDFQTTIPVLWSEYRAHIPEYFDYKKLMQGYLATFINEVKTEDKFITLQSRAATDPATGVREAAVNEKVEFLETYYRWVVKDAPAFREEPHMTTYRDYISSLNFELNTIQMPDSPIDTYNVSWEDLNHDYDKNSSFGGVVKGSSFLKDHVEKAIAGKTSESEKIGAIYDYVKSLIVWDGEYRKYSDENLKRVVESKKGSSADINLMLVSMLQKADITAYPVLISTRNHGFIRMDNPVSSQFNYVIAAIVKEGKYQFLDATERSLPINVLPERCLNGNGFLVAEGKGGWIKINPVKSKSSANIDLTLTTTGELKGKILFINDGYYAQNVRNKYTAKGKEEYVKELASNKLWEISSSSFENIEKLQEAVKETHEIQINEHIQLSGDHMYINPFLVNRISENPFHLENRQYPVDFGSPEEKVYIARIALPEDWIVEELPKPKILVLPANATKYVYSVTQNANVILVTCILSINKALFTQEEYGSLRNFYAMIVANQAEQLVLKKR